MRSSTAVGFETAFGRLTSMPRYIMGAVSMKISSRTSTTSTSGMILISARLVPIRRVLDHSSVLNAIFGGASQLGGRSAQKVEEVQREAFHLDGPVLHAVDEVVVPDDGGNRGAEPRGCRHQRLGDPRRDDGEACRSLRAALCTMDGRRASRKILRNSSVCRRTRRNWKAFSTMSAQLTMEKTISTRRTTLAMGPEFQTRDRIPEPSVSLGTGAPLICVQRIYGIITTSVGRAVVLPLLLASLSMGAPAAMAQDARAAVEAFIARLPDVQISDLVIDQNLTLYYPDGQRQASLGEQRMFFKLPRRQRLEQTVEGQRVVQITVGDRVWVRRADGLVSEIPAAGPVRALARLLVPGKRLATDLLAEWRGRGPRGGGRPVARPGRRPG